MSGDSDKEYLLGKNEGELERLRKQHRWYLRCFDNKIIFAPVQLDTPGLKILDVGCADGTLLRDLQKQVDTTAKLVGADISRHYLPPSGNGVTYQYWDICDPPTDELKGFDLTHLRLVLGGTGRVGLQAAVSNLAETLAPGGWLQVQEIDMSPDTPGLNPAFRDFFRTMTAMFEKLGMGTHYPSQIGEAFRQAGLQHVTVQLLDTPVGKKLGDSVAARESLESWRTTIPTVIGGAKAVGADLPESVYDRLEERFVEEAMEQDAVPRMYCVTGQKAA